MKSIITIDQRFAMRIGGLDIVDLALFDYLKARLLITPNINGMNPIDPHDVINDMPILGLNSTRSVNSRLEKLTKAGLIVLEKGGTISFMTLGENGEKYDWGENPAPPITKEKEEKQKSTPLEERERKFKEECMAFKGKYDERMLEKFFLYWSEPNKSRTKMRFEQQPTWELDRRLRTWASRNEKNAFPNPAPKISVNDALNKAYGKH